MGVGDSLEAAVALPGSIAAGDWVLVGDGIVFAPVDVRFEVRRRRSGAGGNDLGTPASDLVIASFAHHYDPPASGFAAVPFDAKAAGLPADFASGDQLVLRISSSGADPSATYVPNGDGASTMGRIPSLTLPK